MRYVILDQDIGAPLPAVALGPEDAGLALLLRRNDRPIAFVMQPLAPATTLTAEECTRLVSRSSAMALLEDKLREELFSPPSAASTGATVTIAVCTKDRPAELSRCLDSILRLRNSSDAGVEILVVDNAPEDEATRSLVDNLNVRYTCEPRPGLDFARNRALRQATKDYVAFLDDDVEADHGWLTGLFQALAENPDAAALTGLVLPRELSSEAQVRFERRGGFRRGFAKRRYQGQQMPGNVLYPASAGIFGAGCNMVVRRDVALELGGFDEALDTGAPLPGGGDIDIFYRIIRAGYPLVYEPTMLAFHSHRRDHAGLRRQYWTWGTGFMAFVAKTYTVDSHERERLRALVRWWLLHQLGELKRSLRGRSELTLDLALAELTGGLVGLAGTYPRSSRRVNRIRQQIA